MSKRIDVRFDKFDFGNAVLFNLMNYFVKRVLVNSLRCSISSSRDLVSEISVESELQNSRHQKSVLEVNPDFHCSVQFRRIVGSKFRTEPDSAIKELLKELRNEHKEQLLLALQSPGARTGPGVTCDTKLANDVFNAMDSRYPFGLLDREEFTEALRLHRRRVKNERVRRNQLPVSNSDLTSLILTTSVPYVGFGFLDNFIMIMAGESIEMAFGVTLGLSMMAAAALGNTISDVAGVVLQNSVEEGTKEFRILRPPSLSRFQLQTFPVRMAKMLGAIFGVTLGCLLGMTPLLWFDNYSHTNQEKLFQENTNKA
eukprot:g7631.t1